MKDIEDDVNFVTNVCQMLSFKFPYNICVKVLIKITVREEPLYTVVSLGDAGLQMELSMILISSSLKFHHRLQSDSDSNNDIVSMITISI